MMQQQQESSSDTLTLITLFVFFAGPVAGSFAAKLEPVRLFLVDVGILVDGPSVLIPIAETAGLDLARTAIVAGALILILTPIVFVVVRQARRREDEPRRSRSRR